MNLEMIEAHLALKKLVDDFSNLADEKNGAGEAELFLPDGRLEFQMPADGEIHSIIGREALAEAFSATLNPCKQLHHINGQQDLEISDDCTSAHGTTYCEATLVNETDGTDIMTTNYIRYTDSFRKVDGRWYIECRRSTFVISDVREVGR